MYIAGLDFQLSSPKWLEAFVVLSTADYIRHIITGIKELAVISESKGGRIRPESMPSTFLGRIVSPVHGFATFVPPLAYVGAVAFNRFQQPEWMARFAFSVETIGPTWTSVARASACVASFALRSLTNSTMKHLGDQWHAIGRREKSRIVKAGPYAWVRHPGYSSVLLQEALWSVMFWSYIPLVALGITALAFAIKMPVEENLILKDDAVRDEYRQYMKEVPARVIPFVW